MGSDPSTRDKSGADLPRWQWDLTDPGWLPAARRIASPNFDTRPPQTMVDLLVIHHISLPDGYFAGNAVEQLFCNTLDCAAHPDFTELNGLKVSSHFLITRRGGLRQFVDIHARAWHAGESSFEQRMRCNDFSVGIELQGDGRRPFTEAQYVKLLRLTASLRSVLPLRFVAGHSDIAPGRKFDPGPHFDWCRFMSADALNGISRPQTGA